MRRIMPDLTTVVIRRTSGAAAAFSQRTPGWAVTWMKTTTMFGASL